MLAEIENVLPNVTWQRTEGPPGHGDEATFVEGVEPSGWRVTVCAFDIGAQGFPPGSFGYDGAAVKGVMVVRLTRDLAEKAFRLAEEKLP